MSGGLCTKCSGSLALIAVWQVSSSCLHAERGKLHNLSGLCQGQLGGAIDNVINRGKI